MAAIPFNKALIIGEELDNIQEAFATGDFKGSGNSPFVSKCQKWMEARAGSDSQAYLTTSGTSALEFAAMLADIQPGDEIIMPSFTYVSTMTAFVLRGGTCVFIDVEPGTLNMDPARIAAAVTPHTRAIVPVHYSSLPCDMDAVMSIADRHDLLVIEDAACCLGATYKSRQLGAIGHIGCFSFHATKPFTSGGQGGAVLVNRAALHARADQVYENGTDRRSFGRGEIPAYTVQTIGSNYQMSETAAACLWAQMAKAPQIVARRVAIWDAFAQGLGPLQVGGHVLLPVIPGPGTICTAHNGGQFWFMCKDSAQRARFMAWMKLGRIDATFHFQPLHESPLGRKHGRFVGEDLWTGQSSSRMVRLPLFYSMKDAEVSRVIERVLQFFEGEGDTGVNGNGKLSGLAAGA